jgi:hypothetical protein
VVTVRSEAALNLPTWAKVIAALMPVRLNATRRHVAARANVILTLLFRVRPHTSSDGYLFRAMPSDTHVRLSTIGIR